MIEDVYEFQDNSLSSWCGPRAKMIKNCPETSSIFYMWHNCFYRSTVDACNGALKPVCGIMTRHNNDIVL